MDALEEFMRTIDGVVQVKGIMDRVVWAPSSSGRFSCRYFRKSIKMEGHVWKKVKNSLGYVCSIEGEIFCVAAVEG